MKSAIIIAAIAIFAFAACKKEVKPNLNKKVWWRCNYYSTMDRIVVEWDTFATYQSKNEILEKREGTYCRKLYE